VKTLDSKNVNYKKQKCRTYSETRSWQEELSV